MQSFGKLHTLDEERQIEGGSSVLNVDCGVHFYCYDYDYYSLLVVQEGGEELVSIHGLGQLRTDRERGIRVLL